MSAELVVHPGVEVPGMDAFVANYPPFSIAVDGFVIGRPSSRMTPIGPYANFDHHSDVERLATLSTAQQALMAIRNGLVRAFTLNGEYNMTMYANDCDQDVSLAWYLLQNAQDIEQRTTKNSANRLRNLVDMQGDLDATAGAYPYNPNLKLMQQIAWMFEPYTEFSHSGGLRQDNPEKPLAYREVIGRCTARIALHLRGRGNLIPLDTRYENLGGGEDWTMFREVGMHGRIGAFRDGVEAYLIYKGERYEGGRPTGMHDYTIGRRSGYIPFDVEGIVRRLNELEGCPPGAEWGCSGTGIVGGSPRLTGSRFAPDQLITAVNDILLPRS